MITEILGDVPVIKVLDFLLKAMPHDFTKSEIEEQAAVGHTELRRDFNVLLKNNMVVETRRIAGMQLYALNNANHIVHAVIDFCKIISIEKPILTNGEQLVTLVEGIVSEHDVGDTDVVPPDEDIALEYGLDVNEAEA